MPRNNGVYTLPEPPFSAGTVISSDAVNENFSDIATALTFSLASDGSTPLTGPLGFAPGTSAAPGISYAIDTSTGMYYPGTGMLGLSAGGVSMLVMNKNNVGTNANGALATYGNGAIINPVGQVADFAGATPPTGWQLCYGQAISRTGYPELFFIIGTTYGSGDGMTTFNLPDMRGRASFGQDNMGGTAANRITVAGDNFDGTVLGNAGGGQEQVLSTANLAAHTHAVTDPGHIHAITDAGHHHSYNEGAQTGHGGGSGSQYDTQSSQSTGTSTTGISINSNMTGISNQSTGSGVSFSTLSPAVIFNKIIFAGRP